MHALQSPPSYVTRSAAVAKYHHTALPAIGAIAAAGTHRRGTAAPTTAPTMNTKSNVAGKLITRVIDQPALARELAPRSASTSTTAELDDEEHPRRSRRNTLRRQRRRSWSA